MINQLRQMAIFSKTVELGSFRQAADALNLSPSVISHHIAQLEEHVGVALLYRSTRRLSLTHEGELLLKSAQIMTEAAETGLQAISSQVEQPTGSLRITTPAILSQSQFMEFIADFMKAFPKVSLSAEFTDMRRGIIKEGIDVAIRMGSLKDSSLKARKLYEVDRVAVVSRAYFNTRPIPEKPEDIENWDWLGLTPVTTKPVFSRGKSHIQLTPYMRLTATNAHALYSLAKAGLGIVIIPKFIAEKDIRKRSMITLLPEWSVEKIGVYAVWPPNMPSGGLKARFIDFIVDKIKKNNASSA